MARETGVRATTKNGLNCWNPECQSRDAGYDFPTSRFGLERTEQGVDGNGYQEKAPDIESDTGNAFSYRLGVVPCEKGHGRPVLMESHPEENHHGEHEEKGRDAALRLFRSKFGLGNMRSLGLFRIHIGMPEPGTAAEINQNGNYQGDAGHSEAVVVGRGELVDIEVAELPGISDSARHGSGEVGELGGILRSDAAVYELVRKCRDIGVVDKSGLGKEEVRNVFRHTRGKHGAYVYGHIEQAEGRIPFGGIFRVVVEVPDHYLQIALEQARTYGYQGQGPEHRYLSGDVRPGRDSETEIPEEHHGDTGRDAFPETYPVCKPAAEKRHKIYSCEENRINLAGYSRTEAEFGLQEQHEYGQHGVVAEALAGIGEGKGEETFWLIFEHILNSI